MPALGRGSSEILTSDVSFKDKISTRIRGSYCHFLSTYCVPWIFQGGRTAGRTFRAAWSAKARVRGSSWMQCGEGDQRKGGEDSWEGQRVKVLESGAWLSSHRPWEPGTGGGGTFHLSTVSLAAYKGAASEGVAAGLKNLRPERSHQDREPSSCSHGDAQLF